MTIDWAHFTPWSALLGGALIGLGVSMFALLNGRVAGISGLLGSLLQKHDEGRREKGLFVLGILVAPLLWWVFAGRPLAEFEAGPLTLIVAGLLVGLGARYGSGCTSGHGVCGLARLSPRSLVATLSFMASGIGVVFIARHLMGG
ncbi:MULTISPECIES: YeeE/YedE family protein [Pseudomonas]|uniref:YeeE/YedE thiosulfate transporter family protein n=1 Tax=Pseudomonas auratipiscis TaxID=3115853 RepID=A0AB35WM39_9PSED|nr:MULTISPECIES: YeeE/YedE thiosulfate transporter family protein [unclassified Pseudomonas]MEE1864843.1 YeeE/YedE thiosulfate transporter family protein [Pseudomonas sp. 120P]MEE1956216.1 YeeE/YedE thiosulfate transporter family protein [Pseudomonas sp. 119P]